MSLRVTSRALTSNRGFGYAVRGKTTSTTVRLQPKSLMAPPPRALRQQQLTITQQQSLGFSSAAQVKEGAKKYDKNIFLDNLGTIFLSAIGLIIAALVRSSYGTSNRNAIRDDVEDHSALDPMEIDDLRVANSDLTLPVFRQIVADVKETFPDGEATYRDFCKAVRRSMSRMKGDAFTVQLGHLLDRAVVGALSRQHQDENTKTSTDDPLPVPFLLTILSLALHSPVPDRIQALFEIIENQDKGGKFASVPDVTDMVQYLQDTCQLAPDAQVMPTERKYPTQHYHCADAKELIQWQEGADPVDIDAFAAILRSKSVCAWGECYHKKKIV